MNISYVTELVLEIQIQLLMK